MSLGLSVLLGTALGWLISAGCLAYLGKRGRL